MLDSYANITNPNGIDFDIGYDFIGAVLSGTENMLTGEGDTTRGN